MLRIQQLRGAVSEALDAMEADAQRRLDAGDAPMVAQADLDALARVRRLQREQSNVSITARDDDENDDVWRWSEPESVSPDDPIIHGARWKRERDEARQQLAGATKALRDISKVDHIDAVLDPTRPLRIARAWLREND